MVFFFIFPKQVFENRKQKLLLNITLDSTHMQEVNLEILVVCLHYQYHHLFLVPKYDLLCTMGFFFFFFFNILYKRWSTMLNSKVEAIQSEQFEFYIFEGTLFF